MFKFIPFKRSAQACVLASAIATSYSVAAENLLLEEVVVTAQKRSQSLQEVPIAVTAANADTLAQARVENITNISAITPSVSFKATANAAASANIIIRGLGTVGTTRSFEGSVGVFVDGVYRTRSGAALESFLDIGNLQVLRGPQGTLFGKNTSAGAILLDSTRPEMGELTGAYQIGVGNYNKRELKASINAPVSDNAVFRIAAQYDDREGFITNTVTGKDTNTKETKAVKAQYLVEPSDSLSVHIIADYLKSDGDCCWGTVPAQAADFNYNTAIKTQSAFNGLSNQEVSDSGVTLKISYESGLGLLKSITASRVYDIQQFDGDADFYSLDILRLDEGFKSEFFSQEFTLNGSIDSLNADYVIGAFYSDEDIEAPRKLYWGADAEALLGPAVEPDIANLGFIVNGRATPGLFTIEDQGGTAKSMSIFSHVDFSLSEQWNLIAGLRWSEEKKTGYFDTPFFNFEVGPTVAYGGPDGPRNLFTLFGAQPGPSYSAEQKDSAISGTLGLQFHPTDEMLVYVTYNHAFKAGGIVLDTNAAGTVFSNPDYTNQIGLAAQPLLDPSYEPEVVDSYELGAKIDWLDGRARSNIAAFYYDISDLQIAAFQGLTFAVINSDSAEIKGLEMENQFQASDAISLGFDFTWLPTAELADQALNPLPTVIGQRAKWAPKFSSNTNINIDKPISDDFALVGRLQYQYRTKQSNATSDLTEDSSHAQVNINIGLRSETSGWVIELWGQNLTNKVYAAQVFPSPILSIPTAYTSEPRTYGLTLRGTF